MRERDALTARILRVIQRTADTAGNVTMLGLAENISADLSADLSAANDETEQKS